jgi:hypothetical protein
MSTAAEHVEEAARENRIARGEECPQCHKVDEHESYHQDATYGTPECCYWRCVHCNAAWGMS